MPERKYHISDAGVRLIQAFEGLRLTSYEDQANVWTVGYGTTRINGRPVQRGDTITAADAVTYLRHDTDTICAALDDAVPRDLTQNEVDALVSFCYNLGLGAFRGSSLRKALVKNTRIDESLFTRWNKIRINGVLQPSDGLLRRRRAEYALFIS
jgi:lysozyme